MPDHLVGTREDWRAARPGLELLDVPAEAPEGTQIFVAVHLRGEVRNSRPREDRLRVGIQFVDLSDAERSYLASLSHLEAHW